MADTPTGPPVDDDSGATWIVGIDGSDCSRHAALWARTNVDGRATELRLESTWSVPVAIGMGSMSALTTTSTIEALEDAATRSVECLARDLAASTPVPISTAVAQGNAASLLLDAAQHSDLLVVGSRGLGGFSRLILGSTSTQCATHSNKPVAVIPPTAADLRPASILVAFDGSKNSMAALEWALDFADPGTVVRCVYVWDTAPVAVGADQFFFPEASDLARDRFHHLAGQVAGHERWPGVDLQTRFEEGRPRQMLAEHAESCDVLVMGARGHGAIGAALLGSVSTWLLHHIEAAMVVVPQPGPACENDPQRED